MARHQQKQRTQRRIAKFSIVTLLFAICVCLLALVTLIAPPIQASPMAKADKTASHKPAKEAKGEEPKEKDKEHKEKHEKKSNSSSSAADLKNDEDKHGSLVKTKHAIIIDAGSSHTKLFVYNYPFFPYDQNAFQGGEGEAKLIEKEPSKKISCSGKIKDKTYSTISSFRGNLTSKVPVLFNNCLADAVKALGGPEIASQTPIFLGATAGARDEQWAVPNQAKELFVHIDKALSDSPFRFSPGNARILTGHDEGAYGWIATNYLAGSLTPPSSDPSSHHPSSFSAPYGGTGAAISSNGYYGYPPGSYRVGKLPPSPRTGAALTPLLVGALDLGGSSTQISYAVPGEFHQRSTSSVDDNPHKVSSATSAWRLFGRTYNIHSLSLPKMGVNQALKTLIGALKLSKSPSAYTSDPQFKLINPCFPKNFSADVSEYTDVISDKGITITGSSDPVECQALIRKVFFYRRGCQITPGASCIFSQVRLPSIRNTKQFNAFSGFLYPLEFLGFDLSSSSNSTNDLTTAAPSGAIFSPKKILSSLTKLCNHTLTDLQKNPSFSPFSYILCFEGMYGYELLYSGYGFGRQEPNTHNVQIRPQPQVVYSEKVNGIEPTWPLGFLLHQSKYFDVYKDKHSRAKVGITSSISHHRNSHIRNSYLSNVQPALPSSSLAQSQVPQQQQYWPVAPSVPSTPFFPYPSSNSGGSLSFNSLSPNNNFLNSPWPSVLPTGKPPLPYTGGPWPYYYKV